MYQMTETEYKFAELIWEKEPIGSGELVRGEIRLEKIHYVYVYQKAG